MRKFCVTFFPDQKASRLTTEMLTLSELADKVRTTTAPEKAKLPWLKFAAFGEKRTDKNCLRHDANVEEVSGVEGDHDSGSMTFEEAVRKAKKAKLRCLLYTSPSHTPEKQRWRVVAPFSSDLSPPKEQRKKMYGRMVNVFGPIFDTGSADLSRSYLYGSVDNNPDHQAVVIAGDFIDRRADLDLPPKSAKANGSPFKEFSTCNNDSEYRQLNEEAISKYALWVPKLFPDAVDRGNDKGWRVSSKSLGRNLEEAISFSPQGIKDFGVHDEGDPLEGKRQPIEIVLEHHLKIPIEKIAAREYTEEEYAAAVQWLHDALGHDTEATPKLAWLDMSDWDTKPIPERQWSIENIVPLKQAGLLSGESSLS
jgi:hypothetical protein